jgi:predicted acetyltransferase
VIDETGPVTSGLRLRPPRFDDEEQFAAAHQALAEEGFAFCSNLEADGSWAACLERLDAQRRGEGLPAGWVPTTFLVADVAGCLVGRASIRHELNEGLLVEGGHIGYAVLKQHRRRGYATEILRQSLVLARALGVEHVLVTCDDDNVGSATVIEQCGGRFDSISTADDGHAVRRYWID